MTLKIKVIVATVLSSPKSYICYWNWPRSLRVSNSENFTYSYVLHDGRAIRPKCRLFIRAIFIYFFICNCNIRLPKQQIVNIIIWILAISICYYMYIDSAKIVRNKLKSQPWLLANKITLPFSQSAGAIYFESNQSKLRKNFVKLNSGISIKYWNLVAKQLLVSKKIFFRFKIILYR